MTHLSRIHPYPAMMPDVLADSLASAYAGRGTRVLDPFCGTGRTLMAAAARGAHCVGLDTNPLALLLTRAKAAQARPMALQQVLSDVRHARTPGEGTQTGSFEFGRRVRYFGHAREAELWSIVQWLNALSPNAPEMLVLAAVLSATAREVSYCRQDQWKIHRISPRLRRSAQKSAWTVFERRLGSVIVELRHSVPLPGRCAAYPGDARNMCCELAGCNVHRPFDLVITSPPYGDSRTTVQYGGVASLLLSIVTHLRGIDVPAPSGGSIDRGCLGGVPLARHVDCRGWHQYWPRAPTHSGWRRVGAFLRDMTEVVQGIDECAAPKCVAAFVVARRSVGAARVRLDSFIHDQFASRGWRLEHRTRRTISAKLTPARVDSKGRSFMRSRNTATMREEYVLVFRKRHTSLARVAAGTTCELRRERALVYRTRAVR